MEISLISVLVTAHVSGAIIYSLIDPSWSFVFPDDDEKYKVPKKQSDLISLLKFIRSVAGHSLFIFTWILGMANVVQALKKAKHYNKVRGDTEYLCNFIDLYLFSELKKVKDKEIDEDLNRFEQLYNIYAVRFGVHYFDHFNPHEFEFTDNAKALFRERIKLKAKKQDGTKN